MNKTEYGEVMQMRSACAGRAKTRLCKMFPAEFSALYDEECAKVGLATRQTPALMRAQIKALEEQIERMKRGIA